MKRAYLIVDMSNDFVSDSGSLTAGKPAQAIEENILNTAEKFRLCGDLVIFCMDEHAPDDEHFELWPAHCVKGTEGAEIYGKLKEWFEEHKEEDNVMYLPKNEYDAFYKTPLTQLLKNAGVVNVQVAGVCTDICVFNTVYGAYKEGFTTTVSKDECATFTNNQEVFLNHMNAIYKTEIV